MDFLKSFGEFFLFLTTPIILSASLLLTVKTRFIQFRKLPHMFRLLFTLIFKRQKESDGNATVGAHRALFSAMSTTIGISTIVSPVIAIRIGGPGAVLGFLIATILGAAVNFTEVAFALSYRKHHPDKGVAGGPMQYMQDEIKPWLAKWYAFFTFIMLLGWSAAQANQLGAIFSSELVGKFSIPNWVTGAILAVLVTALLLSGFKRISSFSAKLVPVMFLIYLGGSLWIILANFSSLPSIFKMVIESAFAPKAFGSGIMVGGIVSALRWGVFKGLQASEAGVGTQTIPHSMAETKVPFDQGILAMVSTYSAGCIFILSSLVALVTETWLDPNLAIGINMVAASFQSYFSTVGLLIVMASALLFAFGTILGNSFNGSQCFIYLTKNRFMPLYYVAAASLIFIGTVMDVTIVWSLIDYLIVPVVVPHILSIVYLSYKQGGLLLEDKQQMQAA